MKAVILAAGEGVRCRPPTLTRSKVMLPVANRPIIEYVVNSLATVGITDITFVVNYQKERIKDYFKDGVKYGVNIEYVEQKTPLGTANALLVTKSHVITGEGDSADNATDFLVLNGD
ncbi:MAG: nucleotidyltransferase family protein, partial [Methanosarcinales archaeon]|nr:nucleotidyltransferase family protein [Methanosarcinales archaeon]